MAKTDERFSEVVVNIESSRLLRIVTFLALFSCLGAVALGDTVKLKNGSIIKGKVVSFVQGEFTVLLELGGSSKRSTSRMIIAAEDIESIQFDASDAGPSGGTTERESPRETGTTSTRTAAPRPEAVAPPPSNDTGASRFGDGFKVFIPSGHC
jgi:hypothetical protein